jgi:hypothetical protein
MRDVGFCGGCLRKGDISHLGNKALTTPDYFSLLALRWTGPLYDSQQPPGWKSL